MTKRALIAILAAAACAGCVPLPHRHTVRPDVTFDVTDDSGAPVPDATLTFYVEQPPGRDDDRLDTAAVVPVATDGSVDLDARHAWHFLFFLLSPHGENGPAWVWCATAPGYGVSFGRFYRTPERPVHVVLWPNEPAAVDCAPTQADLAAIVSELRLARQGWPTDQQAGDER